jgi:hypothetical protein
MTPYIAPERRMDFQGILSTIKDTNINSPGELNYLITILCEAYMSSRVLGRSYQTFNDIVGALECAKFEFYRRIIAPHEDIKIKENGDVYA